MVHMCMQIVKQEWPQNWTTFVSDIVGASKTSESLCTNNMAILKLLRSSILHWVLLGLVSLVCVCFYTALRQSVRRMGLFVYTVV